MHDFKRPLYFWPRTVEGKNQGRTEIGTNGFKLPMINVLLSSHQKFFTSSEKISQHTKCEGFYLSKTICINARSQTIPPEHFNWAVTAIDQNLAYNTRTALLLQQSAVHSVKNGRTWQSRNSLDAGCGRTQRISASSPLSLWPCQGAAAGVPWRSLQS